MSEIPIPRAAVHHKTGEAIRLRYATTCERYVDGSATTDWNEVTCRWCLRKRPAGDGGEEVDRGA